MDTSSAAPTVLVVEDEALIRMSAAYVLEEAGFIVLEAGDAAEALTIVAGRPDIAMVVTDVRMPGPMDGLALTAKLRSEHPGMQVLVASGNTGADAALAAGAAGFFIKPYRLDAMVAAVDRLVPRPAPQYVS